MAILPLFAIIAFLAFGSPSPIKLNKFAVATPLTPLIDKPSKRCFSLPAPPAVTNATETALEIFFTPKNIHDSHLIFLLKI